MNKILLLSLNFRPSELEKEFQLIQEIVGKEKFFPNNFIDQQEFSDLVLKKDIKSIKRIIEKNDIQNIIVSSEYYLNGKDNQKHYDVIFKDLGLKTIFISHTNGKERFKELEEEINRKYPDSPCLFFYKVSTRSKGDVIEVFEKKISEYFV